MASSLNENHLQLKTIDVTVTFICEHWEIPPFELETMEDIASSPYRIVLLHSNEISETSCVPRRTIQYFTFISTNILDVLSDTAVICSPEFLRIGSFLSYSHNFYNWVTVIYREGSSYVKGTGSSDYMLCLKSSHLSCTWVLWTLLAIADVIGELSISSAFNWRFLLF